MTIAVFGIGNVLMGDDAVGPSMIRYLDALWEFPEGVILEDLGTPSLDLAGRLVDCDAVVFVDAVACKDNPPPGTLRRFNRAEILRHPPSLRLSPHDPSLKETLLTVELLPNGPSDVVLIGIVPKSLDQFGLSDEIESVLPAAADAVLAELARLGVVATRRAAPRVVRGFWEVEVGVGRVA